MAERLQKVLAGAGLGSRRACEELIREGRVEVDGRPAQLGQRIDPRVQEVRVDGRVVAAQALEYWLLNKPAGVVTTSSDPQGRRTVVDCVPAGVRVFPVGRLDRDTTGLLLLTNDGELTHRLLHPRFGVEKEYRALVAGSPSARSLERLRAGVPLEEGMTHPAEVTVVGHVAEGTELMIIIHEGRKRQIRRMLEVVGHPVLRLHRRRVDGLSDEDLAPGSARRLDPDEVGRLRALVMGEEPGRAPAAGRADQAPGVRA